MKLGTNVVSLMTNEDLLFLSSTVDNIDERMEDCREG
jgi:hypothetical protein